MKWTLLLLTLFLVACQNPVENHTVTGPQPLQTIQTGSPPAAPTQTTNTPTSVAANPLPTEFPSDFANQQEFVQFMFDELTALEGTLILLDSNLNEALNAENPASILALRDFMIAGVRQDQVGLEN